MGFEGENHWFLSSFDHDEMYAQRNDLLEGCAVMAYLSFPSLKDRQAKRHRAEIIAPLSYSGLEAYREKSWRRRGDEYESVKNRIIQALLDFVGRNRVRCQTERGPQGNH